MLLAPAPWADHALVDSGGGRKLERYGQRLVIRPEPQCLWAPRLPQAWADASGVFEPGDDEEAGRWRFTTAMSETWPMAWGDIDFEARFTAFRHLGVFPEHAANWEWIRTRVRDSDRELRVLNLFGYTGVASLAAAKAGASVTHVDASKRAVGWAKENAVLSGLSEAPIRWLVEDARKWVAREVRRGARYDGSILDPPKYGRGPGGEVWRLYEDLPDLIAGCAALLAGDASFLLLNAYSERLTGLALAHLTAEALGPRAGSIDWGELALREEAPGATGGRAVGLSFFARWSAP
jgi:23S rRNA (cytosine1962-C5)-methyltransferase